VRNLLFLLLIIAVAAGYYLWKRYREKERRQAVARFASQSGLQYSEDDPYNLPAYDFRLFGKGVGRGCENVLSGRWQDLPVKEADYWYYTESTDGKGHTSRNYHYFSIVIADLPVTVPYVSIQKENLLTRLADHIGFHDIDFESEDFNREFQVTAADKEFAFKLIDPRMMRWLASTGGQFGFEIQHRSLLAACHRLPATGLNPLFGAAKSFTDHIPRLVRAEYGTGQQTPAATGLPSEPPARTDEEKSPS
jgi:hypothetical protein